MAQHNTLGIRGENIAQIYLQEQHYTILHTNWRYKHKEIDIIAQKDEQIIIVEVKTRTEGGMQLATESLSQSKMNYLIEAADAYITQSNNNKEVRFDLIALTFKNGNWEIAHIENAFNAMDI